MYKVLKLGNLTSNSSLIQPPAGFKWKILAAAAWISVGTGTGTRSIVGYIYPGSSSTPSINFLPSASGSLNTSGDTIGTVGYVGISASPFTAGSYAQWSSCPELGDQDQIQFVVSLVSGDSYSYVLSVLEELE